MKLDRKQDLNVLYKVCVFRADQKNKNGRPGLWLAEPFSTSPKKPLNGIQRKLSGSKISTSSTKFVFLGRSEEQDGRPDLWLVETFSTSPLKPLNGIQRNLTGSKISTSIPSFVFFGLMRKNKMDNWNIVDCYMIGKTKWPPWPLIAWEIFDIFSEIAKRNSIPEVPQSPDARLP